MEFLGAVMAIEVKGGGVTVKLKELEVIPLSDAEMVVDPAPTPVARPVLEPMVAKPVLEEFHVTWVVILATELSL
jgi:hypothetical protein